MNLQKALNPLSGKHPYHTQYLQEWGVGVDSMPRLRIPEVLVTRAALQRARPGERVPLPTLHHMKWAELSSALSLVLVQGKTPIQIPWVGPASPYPAPSLPYKLGSLGRRGKMPCPPLYLKKITSSSLRFSKGCEFTLNPEPHFMLLLGVQAS